jgi:hypothetical protein
MDLLIIFLTIFYLNISQLRNNCILNIIICYNRFFFVTFIKYHLILFRSLNDLMNIYIDTVTIFLFMFLSRKMMLLLRIIIKFLIIFLAFYFSIIINIHILLISVYFLTSIPFFLYIFIKKEPNKQNCNLILMEKEFKALIILIMILINLNYCFYYSVMHILIVINIDIAINRKITSTVQKPNGTKKNLAELRGLLVKNPNLKQKVRFQAKYKTNLYLMKNCFS